MNVLVGWWCLMLLLAVVALDDTNNTNNTESPTDMPTVEVTLEPESPEPTTDSPSDIVSTWTPIPQNETPTPTTELIRTMTQQPPQVATSAAPLTRSTPVPQPQTDVPFQAEAPQPTDVATSLQPTPTPSLVGFSFPSPTADTKSSSSSLSTSSSGVAIPLSIGLACAVVGLVAAFVVVRRRQTTAATMASKDRLPLSPDLEYYAAGSPNTEVLVASLRPSDGSCRDSTDLDAMRFAEMVRLRVHLSDFDCVPDLSSPSFQ
ncbi:Aste57867_11537 [Aphanomyces stellatus]|uniref:Aste57867_11537 protein n=1 Tax=Aphanomyces stellatus TaxID=120398 RepID=A0A485KTJ8_9STRA|nr:hypothetical protein As57867_011494 [Aphanomyces stellatus]VFT88398.1 Aste57867_11537 [Aphanomyces stellatus]